MKIKKGDIAVVISGAEKGKEGKVILALPDEGRVVIEGVNMKKKHERPRKQGQKGQIVSYAAPISASNVLLKDPKSGKGTRIGVRMEGKKKIRIARKSGAAV